MGSIIIQGFPACLLYKFKLDQLASRWMNLGRCAASHSG